MLNNGFEHTKIKGEDVILECAASAIPQPTIKWTRGRGSENLLTLKNFLVVLSPISLLNHGHYVSYSNRYSTCHLL